MKWLALISVLALSGCTMLHTTQTDTAADGRKTTTTAAVYSIFGKTDLAKLRTTQTDKSQGIGVAGLAQESPGTNSVAALNAISELAKAAAAIAGSMPK